MVTSDTPTFLARAALLRLASRRSSLMRGPSESISPSCRCVGSITWGLGKAGGDDQGSCGFVQDRASTLLFRRWWGYQGIGSPAQSRKPAPSPGGRWPSTLSSRSATKPGEKSLPRGALAWKGRESLVSVVPGCRQRSEERRVG